MSTTNYMAFCMNDFAVLECCHSSSTLELWEEYFFDFLSSSNIVFGNLRLPTSKCVCRPSVYRIFVNFSTESKIEACVWKALIARKGSKVQADFDRSIAVSLSADYSIASSTTHQHKHPCTMRKNPQFTRITNFYDFRIAKKCYSLLGCKFMFFHFCSLQNIIYVSMS